MQIKSTQFIRPILLSLVFLLVLGFVYLDSYAQEAATAKATFYVY